MNAVEKRYPQGLVDKFAFAIKASFYKKCARALRVPQYGLSLVKRQDS